MSSHEWIWLVTRDKYDFALSKIQKNDKIQFSSPFIERIKIFVKIITLQSYTLESKEKINKDYMYLYAIMSLWCALKNAILDHFEILRISALIF